MDVVYADYGLIAIQEQVEAMKRQLEEELKERKPGADVEKVKWLIKAGFDEFGNPYLALGYMMECEGK